MTTPAEDNVPEIQRRASIMAVRLIRSNCELHFIPSPVPASWQLDLGARVGGRVLPAKDGIAPIQVAVGLDVSARAETPAGAEKAPVAAFVSCDLSLEYRIDDPGFHGRLTDGDVLRFASRNGLFTAWPYLLAHVQSVVGEMMLPLVLPTFRPDLTFPDLSNAVQAVVQAK